MRAADGERRKIERAIHDGAQQRLVALLVRLRLAGERLEPTAPTAGMLSDAATELEVAIDELRDLSRGTHPVVLTDLGLATAIRSAAARTSQRIVLELPAEIAVDGRAEETAYYVFLEAITNAQKHAPGTAVGVHVRVYDSVLAISVSDEGPGGATESAGGGLAGLRERVEEAGGTFHVQSHAGRGTTVTAAIPS